MAKHYTLLSWQHDEIEFGSDRAWYCLNLFEPGGPAQIISQCLLTLSISNLLQKFQALHNYALYGCSSLHSTPEPWPCQGLLEVMYQMLSSNGWNVIVDWVSHHIACCSSKLTTSLASPSTFRAAYFFFYLNDHGTSAPFFFDIKKMIPLKKIDRKNMSQKSGYFHGFLHPCAVKVEIYLFIAPAKSARLELECRWCCNLSLLTGEYSLAKGWKKWFLHPKERLSHSQAKMLKLWWDGAVEWEEEQRN